MSLGTLISCEANVKLMVVNVAKITSVVAMIPHSPKIGARELGERFFVVEKPGVRLAEIGGYVEDIGPA